MNSVPVALCLILLTLCLGLVKSSRQTGMSWLVVVTPSLLGLALLASALGAFIVLVDTLADILGRMS